jgi:hypothetical protein
MTSLPAGDDSPSARQVASRLLQLRTTAQSGRRTKNKQRDSHWAAILKSAIVIAVGKGCEHRKQTMRSSLTFT